MKAFTSQEGLEFKKFKTKKQIDPDGNLYPSWDNSIYALYKYGTPEKIVWWVATETDKSIEILSYDDFKTLNTEYRDELTYNFLVDELKKVYKL